VSAGTETFTSSELFSGSAGAAKALPMPRDSGRSEEDTSFAVVHGLYWLVVNLATRRPILFSVDDARWGDDASLRWLAYLAARLDGIPASLVVSLRPREPRSQGRPLQSVRAAASATLRPGLLSEEAVAAIAQKMLETAIVGDVCASIQRATGGNPFYVLELLRGLKRADHPSAERMIEDVFSGGKLRCPWRRSAAAIHSSYCLICCSPGAIGCRALCSTSQGGRRALH